MALAAGTGLALLAALLIYLATSPHGSTPSPGPAAVPVPATTKAPAGGQRPTNAERPQSVKIGKKTPDDAALLSRTPDPAAVLTSHASGDGEAWQHADDDLLVAWASSDPDAAMRWIDDGPRAVTRAQLLAAVAAGILIRDGLGPMRAFLANHQDDPGMRPKDQGELDKFLFYHLGREDTFPAAMEILRDQKDDELAGYLVLGIEDTADKIKVIDHLQANGIAVAASYEHYQDVFARDPLVWADWANQKKQDFLADIITAWARDNPADAKSWIEDRIPRDDPRRSELDELLTQPGS